MKVMSPAQARSGACGRGWPREEIGRGFVGSAVAGFGEEVFGLKGAQPSLGHEATDSGRGASHAPIGEFRGQATVAVASAVVPEDGLDQLPKAASATWVAVGVAA